MATTRTGHDALRAAFGGEAATTEDAPPKPRAKPAPKREALVVEPVARFAVTTFRIRPDQMHALRLAALDLAAQRGAGKADASEVLRQILDEWMARGGR